MIHRIHGKSLTEVLRRAREEHGEGALVLSQENLPSGEVTIAVSDSRGAVNERPAQPALDPGIADIRDRLAHNGASRGLIDHVVQAVTQSGVKGAYAVDVAARAIGRTFPVHPSPKRTGITRVVALIGPAGAGKTTTLAKIGRRLGDTGRRVLFASLDGLGVGELAHRVQGDEPSRVGADADRHEVEIHAISSTAEIDEAKAIELGLDVIMLDTPGVGVRDLAGLEALAEELGRLGAHAEVEVHLVLPATHSAGAFDLAFDAYTPILRAVEAAGGKTAVTLTKLDEAPDPARALERCRRAKHAISFLADGADARAHLRLARAGHVADLLLRGRLPA